MDKTDFSDKYRTPLLIGIGTVLLIIISIIILFNQRTFENTRVSGSDYIFGIDVSHYQGRINWSKVKRSKHPIKFVFIRSTMGTNGIDSQFKRNWKHSKKQGFIRGAYHYYRPNENSRKQFNLFASAVKLERGDFPPILDIERQSVYGNDNLIKGIKNWLDLAEKKYGIKPVIYTGRKFYNTHLKGHFNDYPLWIASYSAKHKLNGISWTFHQFSKSLRIKGISHYVDGNDFDGNLDQLKNMCIK